MSGFGTTQEGATGNRNNIKYGRVSQNEDSPESQPSAFDVHEATARILNQHLKTFQSSKRRQLIIMSSSVLGAFLFLYWVIG